MTVSGPVGSVPEQPAGVLDTLSDALADHWEMFASDRCGCGQVMCGERSDHLALAVASTVQAMTPAMQAALLGLPVQVSYAIHWSPDEPGEDYDGPWATDAEARAEAERCRIDAADTYAIVASTSFGFNGPWQPIAPPGASDD